MKIKHLYDIFKQCASVITDSRNCKRDAMFFALKGENFDGNKYAVQALNDGCKYAVVDDASLSGISDSILVVDDALATLQKLASYHRQMLNAKIIGITGTNGKTTTKELISSVLSEKYKIWFTQGNLNNHIGVPLTLLSMPDDTEIGVIEMGANHKGEIEFLCNIAQPDLGLITNVGKAHLEGFGSFEGVMETKAELYKHLYNKQFPAFININNNHLKKMIGEGKFISYGTSPDAYIMGQNAQASPNLQFEWKQNGSETWEHTKTKLTGIYNFENALAAVCIGTYFDVAAENINKALSEYTPVNNRSQLITTNRNKVLMDAYNANPDSMNAALQNFDAIDFPKKILILGGMKELGNDSNKEHESLLKQIAETNIDSCYLVGNEFKPLLSEYKHYKWFESTIQLTDYLNQHPINNALILIKGSRSNKLETVLERL